MSEQILQFKCNQESCTEGKINVSLYVGELTMMTVNGKCSKCEYEPDSDELLTMKKID